jgi:hypothetical protein
MKYIIPQEKFKHIIYKYMDDKFNTFESVYSKQYHNSKFYVLDGRIMAELMPTQQAVILDYYFFTEVFDMFSFKKISEFQKVMKEWANHRFDWENSIVDFHNFEEEVI